VSVEAVDPLFDVFTDNEERLAESIRVDGARADTLKKVGGALAAAFFLYRLYMRRRLTEEAAARDRPLTQHSLYELNSKIFTTGWARLAWTMAPAIISGYRQGLLELGTGNYSQGWVQIAAEQYALDLAESLHETSSEAMVQGVQGQINRRVTQRKVIDNVIDAFGVPPRTMNALVNVWLQEPERMLSSQPGRNPIKDRADSIVARALADRARNIGQTEAYAVKNAAKSIVWLYMQQEGQLPKDATKMWVTAKDERTCPVCAPLHMVQVPLDAKFSTAQGEVWAPSLHPRCRCNIVLRGAVQVFDSGEYLEEMAPRELELAKSVWGVVSKARAGDPYDRDRSGKFATTEQRRLRQVAYKEPEPTTLPEVTEGEPEDVLTLDQIFTRFGATLKPVELAKPPSLVSLKPVSLQNPTLQLQSPELSKPALKQTSLKGVSLKGPSLSNRIKFPSMAELREQQPDLDLEENENWKPLRDPVFGLFLHQDPSFDGDHSLLLADRGTFFYPHDDDDSTLQNQLGEYWEDAVFRDLPDRFLQEPGWEEGSEDEDYFDATAQIPDGTGGYYTMTYEEYADIWMDAISGADSHDSYKLALPYKVNSTFLPFTKEIDSRHAAKLLGITEEVDFLMPTVGVTNWKSTSAEEYKRGVFTNPGKWRITGGIRDNTKAFLGRDQPLPYKMVFVEPDDLFPD
jgi:hypothetical protein